MTALLHVVGLLLLTTGNLRRQDVVTEQKPVIVQLLQTPAPPVVKSVVAPPPPVTRPRQISKPKAPAPFVPVAPRTATTPSVVIAESVPTAVAAAVTPTPVVAPAPPPPVKTAVSISASYAASNRKPDYPAISRRYEEQGTVILRVFVNTDGSAGAVQIKSSSGFPLLDQAARDAVQSWHFQPATVDGKPIAEWYQIPIPFKLQN